MFIPNLAAVFAYDRLSLVPQGWQGTLIEDKRDAAGTYYRRNRQYDPITGRFTQEDPIGLAGGLNLYAYANGDPVNLSDPFGLCPIKKDGIPCTLVMGATGLAAGAVGGAVIGGVGGTFVVPGVGTVAGAAGGAVAGGRAGLQAGLITGAAQDLSGLLDAFESRKLGNKIRSFAAGVGLRILDLIGGQTGEPPTPPEPPRQEEEEKRKTRDEKPKPSGSGD
jgi:RHS repeat-associated protein